MKPLPDVIAIDGPAASGKSTIGLMLARRLVYLSLDTGIMYRALTLAAIRQGIAPSDEARLSRLAKEISLQIIPVSVENSGPHYTVWLDGQDVTWDLRLPEVDANVSQVSTYREVRAEMVRRQRLVAEAGQVVIIGRDIGTVVVPDAGLKLYITASSRERASRRQRDRLRQGYDEDFDSILADVTRRDHVDSNRRYSPLQPAEDAIVIDTTGRTADEVLDEVAGLIAKKQTEEPA